MESRNYSEVLVPSSKVVSGWLEQRFEVSISGLGLVLSEIRHSICNQKEKIDPPYNDEMILGEISLVQTID